MYLAGTFQGDVDFDPGVGTHTHSSQGSTAGFLLKLDSNGEYVQTAIFSGTVQADVVENLCALAIGPDADVYVGGVIWSGAIDVDPGPGLHELTAPEPIPGSFTSLPVFVLRLSPDMTTTKWVHSWWGEVSFEIEVGLSSVRVTETNEVVVTGYYDGLRWDDPVSGVTWIRGGGNATFVRRIAASGEHLWTRGQTSQDAYVIPHALAVTASDEIYVVGGVGGLTGVDFDPGPGYDLRYGVRVFIWRLTADGEYVGTVDNYLAGDIAAHVSGGLVVSGSFEDQIDLDPGPGVDLHEVDTGEKEACAVLLGTDWTLAWSWVSGLSGDDFVTAIASDDMGRVYVAVRTTERGSMLVGLSAQGQELWRRDFPGWVRRMVAHSEHGLYLAGQFSDQGDFNPGPGVDLRTPIGPYDDFITRLSTAGTYG